MKTTGLTALNVLQNVFGFNAFRHNLQTFVDYVIAGGEANWRWQIIVLSNS